MKKRFSKRERESCSSHVLSQKQPNVNKAISLARQQYDSANFASALAACEAVLATVPSSTDNLLLLGAIYFQLGDISKCVAMNLTCLAHDEIFAESYSNLGNALKELGDVNSAKTLYLYAIRLKPRFCDAYNNLAAAHLHLGETKEAAVTYETVLLIDPTLVSTRCHLGNLHRAENRIREARRCFVEVIRRRPDCAVAWAALAGLLKDAGHLISAAECYREALRLRPRAADVHSNLGNVLKEQGLLNEAIASYEQALLLDDKFAVAYGNLASCYMECGQLDKAIATFRRALDLEPDFADAYNNLGNALREAGRLCEAITCYKKALALRPNHAHAHNNLGNAMKDRGHIKEAVQCYETATRLVPRFAAAHSNLGLVLKERGDVDGALRHYQEAIAIDPTFADPYSNMGNAYKDAGRLDEAIECYSLAIKLRPDFADAYSNLASAYKDAGRNSEAVACYRQALRIKPDFDDAFASLTHSLVFICDWTDRVADFQKLHAIVQKQLDQDDRVPSVQPFHTLVYPVNIKDMYKIAHKYAKRAKQNARIVELPDPLFEKLSPSDAQGHVPASPLSLSIKARLRVGYVSSDLGNHPLAHLMQSVFGLHDKKKYEIACYSLSPDDGSSWRRKIEAEVEHFVDISALSLREMALRIRADDVDILINLNGYTKGARNELFALRVAPVQASYMGFCGTLGAKYIQYLVADHMVVPAWHEPYYAEKIVRMPHSYFVNDHAQSARYIFDSTQLPTRSDFNVPEDCTFLYANFNQIYKIDPTTFDVWCRILRRVRGSVLWLLRFPPIGEANIRAEARKRGVPDARLHFTAVSPKDEHIRRGTLADLFLDTPQCNAHTTGCDILWGGCPMLTLLGEKMATRVAASLLKAVDCDELVAHSLQEYEDVAVHLATDSAIYQRIRRKVQAARPKAPLWDTLRWVRNFERAFDHMWDHRGHPRHIDVEDVTGCPLVLPTSLATDDPGVTHSASYGDNVLDVRASNHHHYQYQPVLMSGVSSSAVYSPLQVVHPPLNFQTMPSVPRPFVQNYSPFAQLRAPTHFLHQGNLVSTPMAPTPPQHFLNTPSVIPRDDAIPAALLQAGRHDTSFFDPVSPT